MEKLILDWAIIKLFMLGEASLHYHDLPTHSSFAGVTFIVLEFKNIFAIAVSYP